MIAPARARTQLAFAADLPLAKAKSVYEKVKRHVAYVKVGLPLFVEQGPRVVEEFQRLGAAVFLDLKLHDIPNTVELAARHAAGLGVSLLTVHALGGDAMLRAAVQGAAEGASAIGRPRPKVLAVTLLTSLSDSHLREQLGFTFDALEEVVIRLAQLANECGLDGLVCSPQEVPALRKRFQSMFLCTPGIRQVGGALQDQARIQTPAAAAKAGSDLLVVGRPIYMASDPEAAARAIADEIAASGQPPA